MTWKPIIVWGEPSDRLKAEQYLYAVTKAKGIPVHLIDHGPEGRFLMAKINPVELKTLKGILKAYVKMTGVQVYDSHEAWFASKRHVFKVFRTSRPGGGVIICQPIVFGKTIPQSSVDPKEPKE